MRYGYSSIKKALAEPRNIFLEFNRYVQNGTDHRTEECYNQDGVNIFESDWDNLVILDACRYDVFKEKGTGLPGELQKKESIAGATVEFIKKSFDGRDLRDTIYVTASPQLHQQRDIIDVEFYKTVEVWKNNWEEDYRTVKPDKMTDIILQVEEKYPNKRILAHYIQPHTPFIGPTGDEIQIPSDTREFWDSFRKGKYDIDLETAKKAYRENVEVVIPHVETLLNELQGKTIVTSDHGEMMGERDFPIPLRRYGHINHTYLPSLVEVPWLTYQNGSRKNIIFEEDGEQYNASEVADDIVKERLSDLGYT